MSRTKNVSHAFQKLKLYYETGISHSCSYDAAVFSTNAIWIFPIGEVCSDGRVWSDGLSLLYK